jgi:hypothetical protein
MDRGSLERNNGLYLRLRKYCERGKLAGGFGGLSI